MAPETVTRELLQRIRRLERDLQRTRTNLPRNDFEWHGARLLGAGTTDAYFGGGQLAYTFGGTGRQNRGNGATSWTQNAIDASNYAAVVPTDATFGTGGGSYVTLNGTDEYLSINDASWQEPGAEEVFVWSWVYGTDLTSDQYAVAKWDVGGDQRCYRLLYNNAVKALQLSVSSDGTAATVVSATSTYAEAVDTWYFLAGYYEPSSIVRVYVGAATDVELTADDTAGAPPASLFSGTANLLIGAGENTAAAAYFWTGRIGRTAGWYNTPSANIGAYANRIFNQTKWAYGGYL